MSIVLGVDLDEVVFHYIDFLREYLRSQGLQVPDEQPETWSLKDAGWVPSIDDYFKYHGKAVDEGLYEKLKVIEGARENLWDLSNAGYQLNIITSRFVLPGQHQKVVSQTVKALDANRIPYSNLSFMNNKVLQYADAYIDDSPSNVKNLHDAGRFVICFDMRYNQNVESSARATNWKEVREILKEKFGK